MKKMETFKTTDFDLGSCLLSLNQNLERIDFSEPERYVFMFERTDRLDEIIQAFWARRLSIEPLNLFANQRMLKTRIHSRC